MIIKRLDFEWRLILEASMPVTVADGDNEVCCTMSVQASPSVQRVLNMLCWGDRLDT
jgi:hypothetical protein